MTAPSPLHNRNIGFIGAGAMASAIIEGLLASGISPGRISASDPWEPARAKAKAMGLNVTGNAEVAIVSEIIVVAVKPDVVASALAPLELRGKLVVSIAAGVPLMAIEIAAGNGARCVRTMPNTPCLLRQGVTGVAAGPGATRHDLDAVASMFRELGAVVEVDESLLDAVTAVSGSGPAWFFRFVEALESAAIELGLSPDDAATLVRATAAGAGQMMLGGDSPSVLRERVTTPNGTTAAGLEVIDKVIDSMAKEVLTAARDRGAELGRQ